MVPGADRIDVSGRVALHPSDLAVFQADLDSPGMVRGSGEDVLHDAVGQLAGALVLLRHDADFQPRANVDSPPSVHDHRVLEEILVDSLFTKG